MGNWLPEMVEYIQASQSALAAMPTALFTIHMLNAGTKEKKHHENSSSPVCL